MKADILKYLENKIKTLHPKVNINKISYKQIKGDNIFSEITDNINKVLNNFDEDYWLMT